MLLLQLTLLFVLVAGAGSSEFIHRFNRAGDKVTLPCNSVNSSDTSCSIISWWYYRDSSATLTIVHKDRRINEDSPKAAKVSLGRRCSLTITNISSKDAGHYYCRYEDTDEQDTNVLLNILTLSADQSTDPKGGVTLTCTLRRITTQRCDEGSLRWLDEEKDELKEENDEGYHLSRQTNSVSHLTITHQSNHSRSYTCQFVKDNEVKISADYTLVSTVDLTSEPPPNKIIFIIIGATVGLLTILVVVILTVFIKSRRKTGAAEDAPERAGVPDEPETNPEVHQPIQQASLMDEGESSVTYVTVSYRNRNQEALPSSEVREPEEEVTYATVKK